MRKLIRLKIFSLILLAVMLTVTINGVHENAHAMQSHVTTEIDRATPSGSHHCPCDPLEHHEDSDCCDICVNCACHAPLTVQSVQVVCSRQATLLVFSEPFKALPEVYLSKFIPPHILA